MTVVTGNMLGMSSILPPPSYVVPCVGQRDVPLLTLRHSIDPQTQRHIASGHSSHGIGPTYIPLRVAQYSEVGWLSGRCMGCQGSSERFWD